MRICWCWHDWRPHTQWLQNTWSHKTPRRMISWSMTPQYARLEFQCHPQICTCSNWELDLRRTERDPSLHGHISRNVKYYYLSIFTIEVALHLYWQMIIQQSINMDSDFVTCMGMVCPFDAPPPCLQYMHWNMSFATESISSLILL